MSGWGIAETAPVIEKIKADSADYLRGLNSCGDITWSVYDKAFDFYMELISRAYEQGKKDAEPHWISCSEQLPEEGNEVLVCLTDWQTGKQMRVVSYRIDFNMWHGYGRYNEKCVAWMPLPEPWKGDAERRKDD